MIHAKCLVCNSTNIFDLPGYEKHNLVKCKNCRFVFIKEIPSHEELTAYYSTYTYGREHYLSPITIKSYNTLLDEFECFRVNNKILDVGCGLGFFLEEAQKRGWQVYGSEYSTTAVEACQKKGISMKTGKLSPEDFVEKDFDIVTSFEVIEHINNPREELNSINRLLRKGGLFYCTTPNFNSLLRYYLKDKFDIITYPEHLSYYTKRSLNKAVTDHGFQLVKFLSTGISITRFEQSTGKQKTARIPRNSSDEVLRRKTESKWYLSLAKTIVNQMLTVTNTGLTLKGYYIKK